MSHIIKEFTPAIEPAGSDLGGPVLWRYRDVVAGPGVVITRPLHPSEFEKESTLVEGAVAHLWALRVLTGGEVYLLKNARNVSIEEGRKSLRAKGFFVRTGIPESHYLFPSAPGSETRREEKAVLARQYGIKHVIDNLAEVGCYLDQDTHFLHFRPDKHENPRFEEQLRARERRDEILRHTVEEWSEVLDRIVHHPRYSLAEISRIVRRYPRSVRRKLYALAPYLR